MKKHLPIIIALAALVIVPLASITHSKHKKAAVYFQGQKIRCDVMTT